jgi:pullulanase/glycogen debranching enzyme
MTEADWNDGSLRCLAVQMSGAAYSRAALEGDLLIVFNSDSVAMEMPLPQASLGMAWQVVVDTAERVAPAAPRLLRCKEPLRVEARSTVMLESLADQA